MVLATHPDVGHYCLILKQKAPVFVVLTGLEPVTSPM